MRIGVVLLVVILALVGLAAAAQEVGEDDLTDELARIGLEAPPGLRKAKRRLAKEEGWALTPIATASAGYDSNIYLGPNNTTDSAVALATELPQSEGTADADLRARDQLSCGCGTAQKPDRAIMAA